MISLELDRHDFVSAVEGFAHGSHLRQHVWRDIVYRSIPQMTDDEMDYFWYIFRRNLWECYFRKRGDETVFECGCEDYPGMFLKMNPNGENGIMAEFAPYPLEGYLKSGFFTSNYIATKRADFIAQTQGTRSFPWRAVPPDPSGAVRRRRRRRRRRRCLSSR